MNDASSTPLTNQALLRLRKLAEGNGLAPEAIELVAAEEKIYEIEGTLTLTPKTDIQQGRYPGGPQGRDRRMLQSSAALASEVDRHRQQFMQGHDWVDKALEELKASEGHGWGLDGAEVTMPERTIIFAATDGCPVCHGQKLITCQQCRGQGLITCPFCHGNRQERCYTCGGTGYNPQNPNQPCVTCHGQRFVLCRHCQGRGQQTCPTCHGKRGTPCPNCKGTGQITQETAITFSATTHFILKSQGLPSGLRRGLDRLGIMNLSKGHADIELVKPKTDDEPQPRTPDGDKQKDNTPPKLDYVAKLPYADIKLKFGTGRVVLISAFGKRGSLLGVPPFLDEALQPARDMLKQGATNSAAFEGALKARAIHDALGLEVGGKGLKEFRGLYPIGISNDAANEILSNLRMATKAFTRRLRIMVAAAGALIGGGLFATVFLTDVHASLTQSLPVATVALLDLLLLGIVLGANILALGASSRMALQRRFPHLKIALKARISGIDYGLLAAILVIYGVVLCLAPLKPVWLQLILSRL